MKIIQIQRISAPMNKGPMIKLCFVMRCVCVMKLLCGNVGSQLLNYQLLSIISMNCGPLSARPNNFIWIYHFHLINGNLILICVTSAELQCGFVVDINLLCTFCIGKVTIT